jgi:C4-dicarboxylate transporter DctQ subunit
MLYQRFSRTIGWINRFVAALGIAAGVALAFVNVVARYLFNSSLTWASELTIYLFIWSAFFGAAYCFKKDAHISVDVLLEKVPPGLAKVLMLFSHLVTLLFLVAVAWYGYQYLLLEIDLDERSVDLEIPMWIPYSVIPIAFASAAVRVVEKIVDIVRTPADEVVRKSEAEMILAEMENLATPEAHLAEAHKRTGGLA